MRKGRLIALLPPERIHGDGSTPKVGDVVTFDQGFTFPDGRPGSLVYCVQPDGQMWGAEVYDSEVELIATHAVSVEITDYIPDPFPGAVSCALRDAHDYTWQFIEKVPIVSLAHLTDRSPYPQRGEIRCEVQSRYVDASGRAVAPIDTRFPDGVATINRNWIFEVLEEQLVEITDDA